MARQPRLVCEPVDDAQGSAKAGHSPLKSPEQDIFSSAEIPTPTDRPLRIFAFDPSAGRLVGNYMTVSVRYEKVSPGPVGERFAVIDYDGGNKTFYAPIDLNDSRLLVGGGLAPSESDPRFHQQMVYAVASETLQRFEYALGRRVRWRGTRLSKGSDAVPRGASQRLNLYPHAMRQANAFYSPEAHGVLFGYFKTGQRPDGRSVPGQIVFTCLSHDIIAHETTHAIVDGIRGYFMEATNIDVAAFHEAFADLAALFSHFAHKDALLDTLRQTGGRLFDARLRPEVPGADESQGPMIQAQISKDNPLIALAMQFGSAFGLRGGLRSALGTKPTQDDIRTRIEPHERGAILVAAVFDAYFTTYTRRTADLFRIFKAGGGTIDRADLPAPLADRLAEGASQTADEFFTICARALDYCPPVDITFGDFLRAVLTAHLDLHPEDPDRVREALMEAFRSRGIFGDGTSSFTEESLFWPKVRRDGLPTVDGLLFGDPNGLTRGERDVNGEVLRAYAKKNAKLLGFNPIAGPIHAPSFHPMFHMGQDGRLFVNMVVELVQTLELPIDENDRSATAANFPFRNGVTLLISQDPPSADERPNPRVRFAISKLHTREREERVRNFYLSSGRASAAMRAGNGDPDDVHFKIDFCLLHGGV
jgi:hypothetical protein